MPTVSFYPVPERLAPSRTIEIPSEKRGGESGSSFPVYSNPEFGLEPPPQERNTHNLNFPPYIPEEFRPSAIPDADTLVNVRYVEGQEAIEILTEKAIAEAQKVTSYATIKTRKILDTYQFAADGGWVTYGSNLEGTGQGEVAYFKPRNPRQITEAEGFGRLAKVKTVKYETPKGQPATPLIPFVTFSAALKIAKKHGVLKDYEAWVFSQRSQIESIDGDRAESLDGSGLDPTGSGCGFGSGDERGNLRQHSPDQRSKFIFNYLSEFDQADSIDYSFWKFVEKHNLPIALTEGFKKALSLIAHGIPAIALRGISNWHEKGNPEALHPALEHFATSGRSAYIFFDQDEKPQTQEAVRRQINQLGEQLKQRGAKVFVPVWDGKLGKGIDDAIFNQKEQGQLWFDSVISSAFSFKDYKKDSRVPTKLNLIQQLNALSYPVERATSGEYLPELPSLQPGAIHVLTASMGSGKTTRIGQDWVKPAISAGWNVLVLAPLNSLGQQTAQDWGLPHIHDYNTSTDQQQALWADISYRHGLVCCPDSLHRLPDWFLNRPVLLVLDEGNQVISHLVEGNTLKDRQSDILERFAKISKHAIATGAIVLSEDGLPNRAVDFIKTLSGTQTVRVFRHQKEGVPWDCTIYDGQASGYRRRFLEEVGRGKRLLYVTSSQAEAKRMERAISRRHPGLKVVRIDSETNEGGEFRDFFSNPDQWLQANQPDILLLSPSVKSGVSIEGGVSAENAYFSEVWGYFPVLGTDTQLQLLGRYRPPVPRHIFCPDFVLTNSDESLIYPRAIQRRLERNSRALAAAYELIPLLTAEPNQAESLARIQEACLEYYEIATGVSGAQKSIAREALIFELEKARHFVTRERVGTDKPTTKLWRDIQEEIWREQAAALAAAIVKPEHTLDWAFRVLNSLDSSLETRTLAQKVIWLDEFPGVSFDDPEECYQALYLDYGQMRRGVRLQARAENLEAAKEADRKAVQNILSGNIKALHRLPKGLAKATLIAQTGILNLLDGTVYHNQDPRAIAIKQAALKWRNEVFYWLRLQIKEDQTPVEICNKLLRKLGLEGQAIARPGARGQQNNRHYQVTGQNNPTRLKLLEAARRKLSNLVSTNCRNVESSNIQAVDTPPKTPPDQGLEPKLYTPESLADIRESWAIAETEEERTALRQIYSPEVLERALAA